MDLSPPYDQLVPELKLPEYAGLDDADALARLQAKRVAGPAPMSFTDLLGMVTAGTISPASFAKIFNHPRFDMFYADVMGQNTYAVAGLYPAAFQADGSLQAGEAAALQAYANRTELNTPLAWAAGLGPGQVASARQLIEQGA